MSAQLQLFESRDSSSERWTVRVSRRARRMSVRVYPGGRVEVVVPPGVPPDHGAAIRGHAQPMDLPPRRGSERSRRADQRRAAPAEIHVAGDRP